MHFFKLKILHRYAQNQLYINIKVWFMIEKKTFHLTIPYKLKTEELIKTTLGDSK